jgi:flagellar hook-associated protein 1 FlgK
MFLNISTVTSGLTAAQKALKVVQNNIANVTTPGYARERIEIVQNGASAAWGVDSGIGNGTIAKSVTRIVDEYLNRQNRNAGSEVDYYGELTSTLSRIETLFNEGSDPSISNQIASFFNAWEEAGKHPEDMTYRTELLGETQKMVSQIRLASDEMGKVKNDMDTNISTKISKINELSQKLATINDKIVHSTGSTNTYLDERDQYLDELSKLIDVEISMDERGVTDVATSGVNLVSGTKVNEIKGYYEQGTQQWTLAVGSAQLKPTRGQLAADIELRNKMIPNYEKQLNDFTSSMITQVNAVYATGFGLDGSTGNTFFDGADATSLSINALALSNPETIALAGTAGAAGNSDVAKQIALLRDAKTMNSGTTSLTDFYGMFVFTMSHELNQANDNQSSKELILQAVTEQRQNVQGVNVDEEMMKLLEYQRFYQGNAKMLNTINETFDTLLDVIR